MRNWLIFALCVATILPFGVGSDLAVLKNSSIMSIRAIRDLFLQRRESEIQKLENILFYPVLMAVEIEHEYAYHERIRSPDLDKLGQAVRMDKAFPISLKWFYYDFKDAAEQYFSSRETLYPDVDANVYDRDKFAYNFFVKWLKTNPDKESVAKSILFPPLLTMATLRVHSIMSEQFKWKEKVTFFTSDTTSTEAVVLRNIGTYNYTEFKSPPSSNCLAGAVRLKVNQRLSMIFVISLNTVDRLCKSSEYFLKMLEVTNFEALSFTSQRMFVSIPVIRASSVVHTAKHLKNIGIIKKKPSELETTPSTGDRYLSMALIFEPDIPQYNSIPTKISKDLMGFHVERPFVVAVLQNGEQVPFVHGIIQNPISVV